MTQHVLYKFYAHNNELLYVGITADPPTRFRSHKATKQWWDQVSVVRLEHHPDRTTLTAAERAAIHTEHPKYNILHNHPRHDSISAAMAAAQDNPALLFWLDTAIAPWFGSCPVCDRELGTPQPETVAKFTNDLQPPYGSKQPWYCLTCIDKVIHNETKIWAQNRSGSRP